MSPEKLEYERVADDDDRERDDVGDQNHNDDDDFLPARRPLLCANGGVATVRRDYLEFLDHQVRAAYNQGGYVQKFGYMEKCLKLIENYKQNKMRHVKNDGRGN